MNTILDPKEFGGYVLADGKSIPYQLIASQRSDCCSSRSVYLVTLLSGSDLYFCHHHFRKHEKALREQSVYILDESTSLVENKFIGSEN